MLKNKKNKKGFTLIELLAIIVILAIIAVITVSIILNVVDKVKKDSTVISVEEYIRSAELSLANDLIDDSKQKINGQYTILDGGKKIKFVESGTEYDVNYTGKMTLEGTLVLENGNITQIINGKIDKWIVKLVLGRVKLLDVIPTSTLVTGTSFSAKVKTLANGSSKNYNSNDSVVKTITFLSGGALPDGYTEDSLLELSYVDVSEKQDEALLAFYDGNGNIYVYCEDKIAFNTNSSYMFYNLNSVTNMYWMFCNASNLTLIEVSDAWVIGSTTSVTNMFDGCGTSSVTLKTTVEG